MKPIGSRAERILNFGAFFVVILGVTNVFYAASYTSASTKPALVQRAHHITEAWMAVTAIAGAILVWRFIVYVRGARAK